MTKMSGENSLLGRPLRASPFITGLELLLTGRQRQTLSRTCTQLRAAFPRKLFCQQVCDKLSQFVTDVEMFRLLLRSTRAIMGGKLPCCVRYCGPGGGPYGRYFDGRRDVVTIYVEPAGVAVIEGFFLEEQVGWTKVHYDGHADFIHLFSGSQDRKVSIIPVSQESLMALLPECFMTWSHVVSVLPDDIDGRDIRRITSGVNTARNCASVDIVYQDGTKYHADMPIDEWFVQPWVACSSSELLEVGK